MTDPRPRTDKQLVAAAARWCKGVRQHHLWTELDLIDQCELVAHGPLRRLTVPTLGDVQQLEAEAHKMLPRWLRTARYAVERLSYPERRRHDWVDARTWYRPNYDLDTSDWFDCSWPLLFRDEFYLIEDLQVLAEPQVRALRTFLSEFQGPYKSKEQAAQAFLRKLGIETLAIDSSCPIDHLREEKMSSTHRD